MPADWREATAAIARRTREVLLAHPWSLASLNHAQMGPNAMRHMEQSLAALDGLELDMAEKFDFWGIVDDYVFGNALHSIESLTRATAAERNPALVADALAFGRQQIATGEFPRLAALSQSQGFFEPTAFEHNSSPRPKTALEAQFERGLKALLDGLADRMNSAKDLSTD